MVHFTQYHEMIVSAARRFCRAYSVTGLFYLKIYRQLTHTNAPAAALMHHAVLAVHPHFSVWLVSSQVRVFSMYSPRWWLSLNSRAQSEFVEKKYQMFDIIGLRTINSKPSEPLIGGASLKVVEFWQTTTSVRRLSVILYVMYKNY